jgi:4-diphosphocytidyl-2-C-methyl-D-erythritol kinase
MSGSGATCFGLYENEQAAEEAARDLAAVHRGWWVRASVLG